MQRRDRHSKSRRREKFRFDETTTSTVITITIVVFSLILGIIIITIIIIIIIIITFIMITTFVITFIIVTLFIIFIVVVIFFIVIKIFMFEQLAIELVAVVKTARTEPKFFEFCVRGIERKRDTRSGAALRFDFLDFVGRFDETSVERRNSLRFAGRRQLNLAIPLTVRASAIAKIFFRFTNEMERSVVVVRVLGIINVYRDKGDGRELQFVDEVLVDGGKKEFHRPGDGNFVD